MHPQLESIADEYRAAQARLDGVVRAIPSGRWGRRSDPERWSVAECVAHLNLTSREYLPLLRDAIARARVVEQGPVGRYRRDP
ncbi:MAG TPA: maleylpyruvate isomerase N-terminal domain-containing protein, partial [Gemmatimonadales bacterium]|nr:maleylpyruvate isomerase N-terminal domain-containing protein [Gemmatimonadales bacterium]